MNFAKNVSSANMNFVCRGRYKSLTYPNGTRTTLCPLRASYSSDIRMREFRLWRPTTIGRDCRRKQRVFRVSDPPTRLLPSETHLIAPPTQWRLLVLLCSHDGQPPS
uniref:Uncharacterized protein n=1 Tax=Cacopsylla melanoneura TaxID=428564 RepID=A0A8D8TLB8_9HEMI